MLPLGKIWEIIIYTITYHNFHKKNSLENVIFFVFYYSINIVDINEYYMQHKFDCSKKI